MNRLRSMHIIGSRGSGGAENFFARLVNALAEAGHPVMAVTRPDARIRNLLADNVARLTVPMRNNWDLLSRWQIRRAADEFEPDIVQTYMGRATRLTHLRDKISCKHLARLGGYYDARHYRHADACIALTRGIREYLIEEGVPQDRVFHLPNFVDPLPRASHETVAALRSGLGLPAGSLVVLGVGRLHPNKGFCDLIDAFAQLPGSIDGQPLTLVMAGSGPLEESLKQQAARTGVDARILWTGWHEHPEDLYRVSDLMVCPSWHEPHGNVILEAWAYGTPVISTDTAGGSELITPGVNGVLVPCRDPDRMARAINDLVGNAVQRAELAVNGRRTLEKRFSKSAVVNAYLETYRLMLEK